MEPERNDFDEGIDAYCAYLGRNACPYQPGTSEGDEWLRGWDEAEEIDFEEIAASYSRA